MAWSRPQYQALYYTQKGLALRGLGRQPEACAAFLEAIKHIEGLRARTPGERTTFFEFGLFGGYFRAYRGMVGALAALWIMGTPFGFMAFLGIASLIGVIVSHVIVLFDFIEEAHAKGESLIDALLDAGIVRLRPVLITVGATVLALFPLAMHGGPLWEPLCYAQIGGLSVATFITLLMVPVLYAIFVLDLKIVKWEARHPEAPAQRERTPGQDDRA